MGERRGTKGLELWCRRMTEGYPGVAVNNMTTSWRDGLAFCAIIHHFRPDLIDFSKLNKDDIYYNNDLAFQIAERHLGIPALLEPEDMVEFPVPDRLSILTYLSQYYRAFGVAQGSPSRTVTKRPSSNAPDRGIVSPTPTSPTSKMPRHGGGVSRREPCAKCALPVFIAERLNVGKQLYHRTCFRCARCDSQLTLANYYETETKNQFCCETCPDEEPKEDTVDSSVQSPMLSRSLSDEEKSAGLQKFDDLDEYSADFETAIESAIGENLQKTLDDTKSDEYTKARSFFITSQLNDSDEDRSSIDEVPPELPKSDPLELSPNKPSDAEQDSGFIVNKNDSDEIVNSAPCETFNDDTPCIPSLDLVVNSINSVSEIVEENQPETANEQLGTDKIVTKENKFREDKTESTIITSLVRSRMLLFEKKGAVEESCNVSGTRSPEKKFIPETPPEKQQIFTGSQNDKIDLDNVETDSSNNLSLGNLNSGSYENVQKEDPDDSCVIIGSDDSPIIINSSPSITTTTDDSSNLTTKTDTDYPDDLNPFGDDEVEDSKGVDDRNASASLNPFDGDDDDEEEEDEKGRSASSPKPAVRKKLKINLNITTGHLDEIYIKRISHNPFEEQDDRGGELKVSTNKKVIPAPRISLNPFWSDGEEPDETVEVKKGKPVPLPRNTRSSVGTPEPKPRKSGLLVGNTTFGSNSSISSARSSLGPTLRKKKQAPKPPVMDKQDSAHASPISSPSASAQHSPKSTPKLRKSKKAPQPPSTTSTPYPPSKNGSSNQLDISPIDDASGKNGTFDKSEHSQNSDEWETEKIIKDEVNRNRQSQIIAAVDSLGDNNLNVSAPNKSTYGKWKRRKGPAPSRPIPERRHIKPLPITEIRRELEFIEIQQQGLEKQGVRLEQIIREKCEGPDADLDSSLTPDAEDLILQLFELVNEKNELFRKQAELMYLRRQQRLEEEYADLEYQIRCLMLQPEANKTDSNKAMEEELINRLVEVVERRNEIVEVLEMDRVREAEEDDSINNQLNLYVLKREESPCTKRSPEEPKQKKKNKKEKKFKFKSNKKLDVDKDIDESESSGSIPLKEKKKKKFGIF